MRCHTEIEVADETLYLSQSQYTDNGPTSSRADPTAQGRVATRVPILKSLVWTRPRNIPAKFPRNRTPDLPLSRRMPQPLHQRGGRYGKAPRRSEKTTENNNNNNKKRLCVLTGLAQDQGMQAGSHHQCSDTIHQPR